MFLWPAGETVFDELTLVPSLAVADNFFIGQEMTYDLIPGLLRILRKRAMGKDADERR